jgi:hypothetical protein
MAAIAPREAGEGDDPESAEGGTSADFESVVDRAEAAIEDEEEDDPSRG